MQDEEIEQHDIWKVFLCHNSLQDLEAFKTYLYGILLMCRKGLCVILWYSRHATTLYAVRASSSSSSASAVHGRQLHCSSTAVVVSSQSGSSIHSVDCGVFTGRLRFVRFTVVIAANLSVCLSSLSHGGKQDHLLISGCGVPAS